MSIKPTIGVIGYGNMGAAIANQIKSDYSVFVFDADSKKTCNTSEITVIASLSELFVCAATILIAVKPQQLSSLLKEIRAVTGEYILISIAAGVTTKDIQVALAPKRVKVIRAMPNLFARYGTGVTALCNGQYAGDDVLSVAIKVFEHLGKTRCIDEEKMDAATAVSGSGPGYLSYLIEKDKVVPEERSKYIDSLMPEYIESAKSVGFVL